LLLASLNIIYKGPSIDYIPTELIGVGDNTERSDIHKRINPIWTKKNCHSSGSSLLLCLYIRRAIKLTVVIVVMTVVIISELCKFCFK